MFCYVRKLVIFENVLVCIAYVYWNCFSIFCLRMECVSVYLFPDSGETIAVLAQKKSESISNLHLLAFKEKMWRKLVR